MRSIQTVERASGWRWAQLLSDADARSAWRADVLTCWRGAAERPAPSLQRVFYASLASNNVLLPLSALGVRLIPHASDRHQLIISSSLGCHETCPALSSLTPNEVLVGFRIVLSPPHHHRSLQASARHENKKTMENVKRRLKFTFTFDTLTVFALFMIGSLYSTYTQNH